MKILAFVLCLSAIAPSAMASDEAKPSAANCAHELSVRPLFENPGRLLANLIFRVRGQKTLREEVEKVFLAFQSTNRLTFFVRLDMTLQSPELLRMHDALLRDGSKFASIRDYRMAVISSHDQILHDAFEFIVSDLESRPGISLANAGEITAAGTLTVSGRGQDVFAALARHADRIQMIFMDRSIPTKR